MINHSNTLEHLDIPEVTQAIQERIKARQSRYERLMEQHAALRRQEKLRYLRDLIITVTAFAALVAMISMLFKKKK